MEQVFQRARWIWAAGQHAPNAYAAFQHDFFAPEGGPARLAISADANFAVYLNGEMACAGQYPDHPEHKVYEQVELAVRPGENALRIVAHCPGVDFSTYRAGAPALIFELTRRGRVLAASGEDTLAAPDAGYRSGPIEVVSVQLGFSFEYDAGAALPALAPAALVDGPERLDPRPIPRLRTLPRRPATIASQGVYSPIDGPTPAARMQYAPIAFREWSNLTASPPFLPCEDGMALNADGPIFLLIDLDGEEAGYLDVELDVERPCEVLIGWGEHLDDLRVRTRVGGRNFAARYLARAGRQRFTHYFQRAGLRYLQLMIDAPRATLYYAGALPVRYPVSDRPAFSTADGLHSRIYEICRETLIHCMHDHYEDCPWREQALYTMDSRNQMLAGYYAFGEYDLPRASIRLMAQSLRGDGLLELCAPARVPVVIPSFSAMFLVQLQEYHLFSGDDQFAREMLPIARAIADGFLARAEGGLMPAYEGQGYWNFYEWSNLLDDYSKAERDVGRRLDAPLTLFVALGLKRLAGMLAALGEPDAERYRAEAARMAGAAHAAFWHEDQSAYAAYRNAGGAWHFAELTQALAVCAGACPPECLDAALAALAGGQLAEVTLSHTVFLFDALMTRPARYARLMMGRVARDWGDMLARGASTFWETKKGAADFGRAGSLCHGWSAVPAYLYFAYALGIRPTRPGFAEYAVQPVPCGLYELSGRVVTREGKVIDLPEGAGR
ncbi:MAG: hypothetical protein GX558_12715 [Clostridiales bacterium]|nr:hypothetical protein [Clostridiales bacterium]